MCLQITLMPSREVLICVSSSAHFPTCTLVSLVGSTVCSQLLTILISSVKKSPVCNLDMGSFSRYMVEDDCPVLRRQNMTVGHWTEAEFALADLKTL